MWLILICGVWGWNRECETDDFDSNSLGLAQ